MMPITAPLLETFVQCLVLKAGFYAAGCVPEVGSFVTMPISEAESLEKKGKLKIIERVGDRVSVTAEQLRCPPRDRRGW